MADRYTDVDLMILKRWDEVKALREAFDDLVDRMQDVIEAVAAESGGCRNEKGLSSDFNLKRPSIWFWKPGGPQETSPGSIWSCLTSLRPTTARTSRSIRRCGS